MRALVIYRVDRGDQSNLGVVYKLLGQVRGLEAEGCQVDYIIHDKNHIYKSGKKIAAGGDDLFFRWRYYDYITDEHLKGYDFYIFRYGLATRSFIKCLKRTKTNNKAAPIYIDMPTYPYAREWIGLKGRVVMMLDKIGSSHLRKYVSRVIHSGMESMIHGIPTTRITNGVDTQRLKLRHINDDEGLRLLALGKWRSWHGLDRLIKGMARVKDHGLEITLDIIGDGEVVPALRRLVQSTGTQDVVKFHGIQKGSALDDLFDRADLGVGTLGLHRKDVMLDSSLKHREYIARGLPFILAGSDVDITDHLGFTISVPQDDTALDLLSIIERYQSVDIASQMIEMRKYAKQHLSWQSKMKTLLDELR